MNRFFWWTTGALVLGGALGFCAIKTIETVGDACAWDAINKTKAGLRPICLKEKSHGH